MTTYWLSDFCSLFNSLNINPFSGDDKNFKFNSLTRLIIVVTIVSALLFNSHTSEIFLAGGISVFLSVIIYMLTYNSSEMSLDLNKELKTYTQTQEPIEFQQENLKVGLSKMGAETINDHNVNVENNITLDYSPTNTELKKSIYFFEGDKQPSRVIETKRDPSKYLSTGKQVPTGTSKQLHSLIGKNLSFT